MVLDVAILELTSESAIVSLLASFNISDSETTATFWIVAILLCLISGGIYIGGWVYKKKWSFKK